MSKSVIASVFCTAALLAAPVLINKQNHKKLVVEENLMYKKINSKDTILLPKARLMPALLVHKTEKDTNSTSLHINSYNVSIQVIGNIARTTTEISFYNDLNRQLEGEFVFPLGEGQTVSEFWMEVNGELRKGVMVEKEKGRVAFESTVRRKIDPGLLEWTKGSNYRTRVYPIPAKGSKRFIISYEQDLINTSTSSIYYLPFNYNQSIENFAVNVEVLQQEVKPTLYGDEVVNFSFDKFESIWKAQSKMQNYTPTQAIAFEIPKTENQNNVYIEKNNKGDFFYFALQPEKFTAEKKLPKSISLYWDASLSSNNRKIADELKLLEAYIKKIGNLKIKLYTFSNDVETSSDFTIYNGDWNNLKNKLSKVTYDGGTQLGAIDFTACQDDEIILCSDGLSNFGKSEIKLSKTPVMVITSSAIADFSYLKYVAQSTNGVFINTSELGVQQAVQRLTTTPYRFLGAQLKGAEECYPSLPCDFSNTFAMSGKLKGTNASLILNFGFGNQVVKTVEVNLSNGKNISATDSKADLVSRMWAQKKIAELDVMYDKNEQAITNLGKDFSIVTRNTSLIILDRIEDYIQHKIVPPNENMQKEYFAAINNQNKDASNKYKEHQEQILNLYNEFYTGWYLKSFSSICQKELPKKYKNLNAISDSTVTITTEESGSATYSTTTINQSERELSVNEPANVQFTAPVLGATSNGFTSGTFANNAAGTTFNWDFKDEAKGKEANASIELNNWSAQTLYLKLLKATPKEELYSTYLKLVPQYKSQPSFFLDVSDYFFKQDLKKEALRVLSNISEMELENHSLLRIMAHRLQQLNYIDLAIESFKEVLKIRAEEPQSYRDLALAYEQNKEYQLAVDYLSKVVNRSWDSRFPQIELIALNEINHIITKYNPMLRLDSLDKRFVKNIETDVRIIVNWDTDNCDMDLWVTDPCGEKCFYSNKLTKAGGRISMDFTGGYGPEEFLVKKGSNGKYKVQLNLFGNHTQTLTGPTTVQAELYTNYGRSNEVKKEITLRLDEDKQVVDVGELSFTVK